MFYFSFRGGALIRKGFLSLLLDWITCDYRPQGFLFMHDFSYVWCIFAWRIWLYRVFYYCWFPFIKYARIHLPLWGISLYTGFPCIAYYWYFEGFGFIRDFHLFVFLKRQGREGTGRGGDREASERRRDREGRNKQLHRTSLHRLTFLRVVTSNKENATCIITYTYGMRL